MKNLLINRALAAGTKKLFILLFALVAGAGTLFASDTEVDGIWYDFDESNKTATVTYRGSSYDDYKKEYSGSVVIPSSVTYNGTTYSVTNIGDYAFYNCESLTSVTIPNSVTSIGEWAFWGCSKLTSVTIPNSVTSIGDYAFSRCPSLTSVTIPNGVTNIGDFAFWLCSSLTSVIIPNSVTSIEKRAFWDCSSLTAVTIPNSVTSIGYGAFSECTSLTSVTIPNSVTSIGESAFYETGVYTNAANWKNGALYINNCLIEVNKDFMGDYTVRVGTRLIADDAFGYCSSLTSVTIPNSVTSIGDYAFQRCSSLTSIIIPNSVTSIGEGAFTSCIGLTSVTIEAETPPTLDESAFSNTYCSIYVPCGTLDAYKNAEGWSDYASRIKYAPYSSYNINKKAENGHITTSSTDIFTICDTEHPVICTANPNSGCYFVRWADGNTENPRTIELTQDTTMEAIFDYLLSGKCGKDSALTWTFEPASMALNITGKGALSENYTYGTFIESLTIGNEVTTIGEDAFYKCTNLKNVIIGSSVKVLEESAFYRCSSIETITCYGQRPPTVKQNALYGLDYGTIVYVPADYLETYKMHDAWGLYDVRPLGATSAETEDVKITPSENEANVTWPSVNGAATYELVIKDKNGNIVCTLIFNANGQLTSIAFNAPSRNGAPAQTQNAGFSFTITGLDSGTGYDLTLTAKDNSGNTLEETTIPFHTDYPEGIENVQGDEVQSTKVVKDGQVLILRNGKTYTMQGQEVN